MTNDSGPAATIATVEIKELRETCDRLSIDWHHRNTEATLRKRIDANVNSGNMVGSNTMSEPTEEVEVTLPSYVKNKKSRKFQIPDGIPADVREGLEYMASFHLARAGRIRDYIESLLNELRNARTRT